MRCLNHCPQKAIEAAHGMATAFWIIFTVVNTQVILFIINTLNIQPEVWWWKLAANIIGIGGMVLIATILYSIMHYAMGFKPIKYIVRFTSLTALPFWRRYTFLNTSNNPASTQRKKQP